MNKKLLLSLPLISLFAASCAGNKTMPSQQYEMKMNFNHTHFNILQLSDIHMSMVDDLDYHLSFVDLTIKDSIKRCKDKGEQLDLIVLNGDIFTFADKRTVNEVFDFIDSHKIPWTFTFGNHDDQGYYHDHYIEETIVKKNYAMFKSLDDDVSGRSNFVISLKGDIGGGTQGTVYQLYFFDSHSYQFHDYFGYDYVKKDQIEWYERVMEDTNPSRAKSSVFLHIPVPEYIEAKEAIEEDPSKNIDGAGSNEDIYCPDYNSGLFDALKHSNSTISVHSAHDHLNNFAYNHEGIFLCYGLKATARISSKDDMLGGTLIKIGNEYLNNSIEFESIAHTYEEVK